MTEKFSSGNFFFFFNVTALEIIPATIKTQILKHLPCYVERDEGRMGGGLGETGDIRALEAEGRRKVLNATFVYL